MAKSFTPKIVSANDLFEGDVVYAAAGGKWTRRLDQAQLATTQEDAQALLAQAERDGDVIGAYLVAVSPDPNRGPRPIHFREAFRDKGPSSRPDLGRQATYRTAHR